MVRGLFWKNYIKNLALQCSYQVSDVYLTVVITVYRCAMVEYLKSVLEEKFVAAAVLGNILAVA